jgi:ferritin-like metal-binding protein YciE
MTEARAKIVQYLNEAHGTEQGLIRVLQSQIAMTPSGGYRSALEAHLRETRTHAERVRGRLKELGENENPIAFGVGLIESTVAQALALGKTPLDLLRGSGGEEKLLKNAKDSCAAEALEIATYTALERLARSLGDTKTATLAASICADEERMLERLRAQIPKLVAAVVDAEVRDRPSYEVKRTGAADAARRAGKSAGRTASRSRASAKRKVRPARRVPGVAQAEGRIKGALASEKDLAIADYDKLSAADISERLGPLSQVELAKIEAYERRGQRRSTILGRIASLREQEPWPGYDELDVGKVDKALRKANSDRVTRTRAYERSHKNRTGVITATDRELAEA